MDNSVNNNLNNNVNGNVPSDSIDGVVQPTGTPSATIVQPAQVAPTTIQPVQTVATAQGTTSNSITESQSQPIVASANNINVPKKNDNNTYLIFGFFVGFVLLAAIFMLVLLVTGVIGNRNRLTCTKTINEEGLTHYIERFYKLEKGVYTRVENTDIYTYISLTDQIYDEKFGPIIEIKSGVTEYGFGTKVIRDGNVVTITSYNPNFFGDTLDEVKSNSAKEGFTCK